MQDLRLSTRLLSYWALCAKGARLPEITHFNTEAVQDLWDRCLRLRVVPIPDKPPQYQYEYIGPAILKAYGQDLTGLMLQSKMRQFPGSAVLRRLDTIMDNPAPAQDDGSFVGDSGKIVKYRACLLPFGTKDRGVTHVICGFSWREF